ncbi:serine protein kinase RIO [Promicromonospora sp. NPDC019610]|uniref:serine protein kinase RIO n=1 Tax=Promicromonospora sp. NPDC019610 TaxID=3364405 RepID=UPI0037BB39F2
MPRFPEAPKSVLIQAAAGRGGTKYNNRSADDERRPARGVRVGREDLEGPYPGTFDTGDLESDQLGSEAFEQDGMVQDGAGRHASGVVPHAPDDNHDHDDNHETDPTQPGPGQRWSTWRSVAKGARGPEPLPEWVVTRDAAIDTELGILKTGKEADAFLVERAVPAGADASSDGGPDLTLDQPATRCLLVAKRYRSLEHGQFHRGSEYTEGRTVRRTRDQRAMEDRKSAWGRAVSATQWADAEFIALREAWSAGAPVPYPVQIDGTEVLMEFIGTEETDDLGRTQAVAAPRLTRVRPSDDLLESYWEQLTHGMSVLARLGFAHGDLSPYNILAHGERLVIIDLPQVVDLAANPFSSDVLLRDCRTVSDWFVARGLDVDPDALFADLLAQAF